MRRGAKPGKAKIDARLSVARTSPKNEGSKVRHLQKRLKEALKREAEALEQQTATSEILRVISGSPTDIAPVFDAIVESAAQLTGAHVSAVFRFDGELMHYVAGRSPVAGAVEEYQRAFPRPLIPGSPATRAILECRVMQIVDVEHDPHIPAASRELARAAGIRSNLQVPMIRDGIAIGLIGVGRTAPIPFAESQVDLLKTFADQAVIAIENVRLFNELGARNADLTAALEQQTATSEILSVISSSPTDVQPVFDTIVARAARLCDATHASIYRVDGDALRHMAMYGAPVGGAHLAGVGGTIPIDRASGLGRAVVTRQTVHVLDAHQDPESSDELSALVLRDDVRTVLAVPLLREGTAIGAILIRRTQVCAFTDKDIQLLQTFADQAVIAVENARLFKELQARTTELTRSVSRLTALGEISQAVSSTLDVETVLQTVVSRASQLAGADGCAIYEYDDATEAFHIRATHNLDSTVVATLRATPLRKGEGTMGRAAETREPTQVADIAAPGAYQSHVRDTLLGAGYRALLSVPLLREGQVIGSLSLNRHAPGEFPTEAVEVLKTFATQSALAIQNARLFREIADKSAQLEAASRHKSEFLANMSHELRTPLNAIIGFSEVLVDRMFGELNPKQDEYLKDIYASGQHLLSLINDILDLSKIEAGRMELEATDFDLPSAIDNALTLVRERATRRGITLARTIDEHLGSLRGDERKVKQVLLNLLSNALKFTPEGGRIDVSARVHDGVAEVSVADTGVGIAPEDQEAVFEEFRQVGAADRKVEGTGLGLALSRKFIELHGGRIWVESEVGKGSTFTFTLPVRRED
jgi:signal transduction histidine kinase